MYSIGLTVHVDARQCLGTSTGQLPSKMTAWTPSRCQPSTTGRRGRSREVSMVATARRSVGATFTNEMLFVAMGFVECSIAFSTFALDPPTLTALTQTWAHYESYLTKPSLVDGHLPDYVCATVPHFEDMLAVNKAIRNSLPQWFRDQLPEHNYYTVFHKPRGAAWSSTHRDVGGGLGIQLCGLQVMSVAVHDLCVDSNGKQLPWTWWLDFNDAKHNLITQEDLVQCQQHTTIVRVRSLPCGRRLVYYCHTLQPGDVYILETYNNDKGYSCFHQFAPTTNNTTTSILACWHRVLPRRRVKVGTIEVHVASPPSDQA